MESSVLMRSPHEVTEDIVVVASERWHAAMVVPVAEAMAVVAWHR